MAGGSDALIFEFENYRGPVPHHRMIEGYQHAVPGGGERVLAMAETEAEHRQELEKRQLTVSFRAHIVGQVLSFLLALAVVLAGAWLISEDHNIAGYGTLLVGAAGLIRSVVRPNQ